MCAASTYSPNGSIAASSFAWARDDFAGSAQPYAKQHHRRSPTRRRSRSFPRKEASRRELEMRQRVCDRLEQSRHSVLRDAQRRAKAREPFRARLVASAAQYPRRAPCRFASTASIVCRGTASSTSCRPALWEPCEDRRRAAARAARAPIAAKFSRNQGKKPLDEEDFSSAVSSFGRQSCKPKLLLSVLPGFNYGLCRSQSGYRHAERRRADVVHADAMAELHAFRVS